MVTNPKDFLHIKELDDGRKLMAFEKGVALNTTEFQKYCGKLGAYPYKYHDWEGDLPNDAFLGGLSQAKKDEFWNKLNEIWAKKNAPNKTDFWYMIVEDDGGKKVGLYQDYQVFKSIRDAAYIAGRSKYSLKAVKFDTLADAKIFVQMEREEQGAWFKWPQQIQVIWKKGSEIEEFPGFSLRGDGEEEEEEEEGGC